VKAILLALALHVPPLDCSKIPWFFKSYSVSQVDDAMRSVGMLKWQLARLHKCLGVNEV
jgi:hypothetical protein